MSAFRSTKDTELTSSVPLKAGIRFEENCRMFRCLIVREGQCYKVEHFEARALLPQG